MPEDGRIPTDRTRDGKDPVAAGGEAITATLTGAVQTMAKDVRGAGGRSAGGRGGDQGPDTERVSVAAIAETADLDESGRDGPPTAVNGPEAAAAVASSPGRSRLRDAMRRARQSDAERNDVIVDLRETEIARLELLAENVEDVFDELPDSTDLFDGRVSHGNPPRLWIDVLAHVAMARNKRTYQFVQETRQGRKVVTETTSIDQMGDQITNYVAHRMLERERALLADPMPPVNLDDRADADPSADVAAEGIDDDTVASALPDSSGEHAGTAETAATPDVDTAPATGVAAPQPNEPESAVPRYSGLAMIIAFLLGMIAGAIALFLIGANYTPPAG